MPCVELLMIVGWKAMICHSDILGYNIISNVISLNDSKIIGELMCELTQ